MSYCAWPLVDATIEYLKHWLHDWGDLVLTGVIAWAAIMQWVVSGRLLGLTRAVEDFKNKPRLFCRIIGQAPFEGSPYTSIDAQLSNLASFGIWVEQMIVVLDGKVACEPTRSFSINGVLGSGETKTCPLFQMPFAEIATIGSPKTTVRIQVKFDYSTAHTVGVQTSPIYLMTIDGTCLTELIVEKSSPDASLV